ncbi:unnamed protein product [Caenorhabditis sp. 36 PRJEB53466]|nr:unnamed protein product [Caenorhabditis sp. 36 PRJEB53466]
MSTVFPSPLVALISSPLGQQHAHARGFKSVAHLFAPFTSHDCHVREPIENSQLSHRIRLDIRDISNDGHLLSLSVLPYVLIQALKSSADVSTSIKLFREVLGRWAEPSEHESFGAYLACMFVVSTQEENPLGELSKMIQTQQTLYNSTSTLMIPPFCCSPKWATAHAKTPKHYILLHDSTTPRASTERRDEIFAQMCATYGNDNCQVLQFDSSTESPEMEGIWSEIDELNDVLGRGLDDAFQHAADSTPTTPGTNNGGSSLLQSPSSPSFVSTISSILPPSVASVSPNTRKSNASVIWKKTVKILSSQDAKSVQNVIGKFLSACLTPHVEREMRSLYEAVGQKKGIGKSISTGMRKWFGTGSSSGNLAVPASYSWDSAEMQVRRLADLLLMFGSHGAAYEQYLPLKRDLEADKALVAHAVALEMCCVALHSAQPHLNAKQFPVRYLETPVPHLLEHAKFRKYPAILRCAFNISDIYSDLGCHKEAAATLARVSALEGDHLVAVAQTLAADHFEKAGMARKASFHRVLAANRYSHAGIHGLAFDCYRLALPAFDEKHWGVLDEHLAVRLLQEGEKSGQMSARMATECVRRLVAVCPKLSAGLQEERLRTIVHVLQNYHPKDTPVQLLTDIPKVEMDSVKVIYGERPLWNEIDENENQSVSPADWITVERAAHYALFGASAPYRNMQLVSDEHSDNQKTRETPAGERFRVMVDLTNPLKIPIELENVRVSVTDFTQPRPDLGTLPHLKLEPEETKTVELYVFPRVGCLKFKVDGLLFRLKAAEGVGVETRVPLECRGKRMNKTAKQQKAKVYAPDERLSATVAQKPWPLLEFRALKSAHKWSYCDQAQRYQLEVENIGNEDVLQMSIATNAFDRISAGILRSSTENEQIREEKPLELAANDKKIATFQFRGPENAGSFEPFLKIGEKTRIFFDIRSADEPSAGSQMAPKAPSTIVLIGYRSAAGTMRQWRRVVDGERRRLIAVHAEVLDLQTSTFALHLKNCVAVSQAALSRVEILRIRSARNAASAAAYFHKSTPENAEISLISPPRKLEIESEQTDTLVARILEHSAPSATWISSNLAASLAPPVWPCPAEYPNSMDDEKIRVAEKIGVLWKANIVNNEGLVTSFIGESFVDDPFGRNAAEKKVKNGEGASLQISCETLQKEVSHDFSLSKMCQLPIVLKIRNVDASRAARIRIKHVAKVRDAVDGIHLIAPECRQQMWTDRPIRRRKIAKNEEIRVEMTWRVAHSAVYDVGGANLQVEAQFDNGIGEDEKSIVFKVPSVLTVVKSVTSFQPTNSEIV